MIKLSGVSKKVKKNKILDNVTLSIDGIYGLIGPNGAGKSTLMKIISSLTSMDKGEVYIDGENVIKGRYTTPNNTIAYLPQEFMIYPNITVYDALDHIALLKGIMDKKQRQQKIICSLKEVNLLEHKEKKMIELSGGMKKRVGIAQLLLSEPSYLLFDEPTAGLDIEERIVFRNLLRRLGNNHTVVISSHIIEDIEFLSTKLAILKKGTVLFEGTPEELKEKAQGQIWERNVPLTELDTFISDKDVVTISEENGEGNIRLFTSEPPSSQFTIATPRLVDGYLTVVRMCQ